MSLGAIEALLRGKIGLDPASIGSRAIDFSVAKRMEVCGVTDQAHYFNLLQESPGEMEELVEMIVVPETWFFRDKEPFVFLKHYIEFEWLPRHKGSCLQVLSAPCATGEEPYSIAMLLMESGLDKGQFHIDALDISRKAIEKAKTGVYGKNSFRRIENVFLKQFFIQTEEGLLLDDRVRRAVTFKQANLIDASAVLEQCRYDVIFCRNVLIYFDSESKKNVFSLLDRSLAAEGILFLGHVEMMQMLAGGYDPVDHPRAFAFKKTPLKPGQADSHKGTLPRPRRNLTKGADDISQKKAMHPKASPVAAGARNRKKAGAPDSPHKPDNARESLLSTAQKLADRGNLNEAKTVCERFVREQGPSAQGLCLLGLISESLGEVGQAETFYDKALFLDPDNYETIMHLALLMEKRNAVEKARVLRKRAERIQAAQHQLP